MITNEFINHGFSPPDGLPPERPGNSPRHGLDDQIEQRKKDHKRTLGDPGVTWGPGWTCRPKNEEFSILLLGVAHGEEVH